MEMDILRRMGRIGAAAFAAATFTVCMPGMTIESMACEVTAISVADAKEGDMGRMDKDYSDSYKDGKYYKSLQDVQLGGNQADNIVAIAESQLGYKAGLEGDYSGEHGNKEHKKYTEYSRATNIDGLNWCGAFVSWCARKAGISTDVVLESNVAKDYIYSGTFYDIDNTETLPKKGDILLFEPHDSETGEYSIADRPEENNYLPVTSSHVAIVAKDVTEVGGELIYYEGNAKGKVKKTVTKYNNSYGNSACIQGYVRPAYKVNGKPPVTEAIDKDVEQIPPEEISVEVSVEVDEDVLISLKNAFYDNYNPDFVLCSDLDNE